MKMNQFAIYENNFETKVAELKSLKFLPKKWEELSECELFFYFLSKCFPEVKSISAVKRKIKALRANETQDVLEYLEESNTLSTENFYHIALQLLGFLEEVDYKVNEISQAFEKINLPRIEKTGDLSKEELIEAWYLLLITHNKTGLMLIDFLASKGYFKDFDHEIALFFNGKAMSVFETTSLIREVVYVETDVDTDEDGLADLVKVEIVRPRAKGKIPALFTASPYNQGINPEANDKKLHDVNVSIERKIPNELRYEEIQYVAEEKTLPKKREISSYTSEADETFTREANYSLNDFFLSRGFAAVYATGIGGMESEGIMTCASVKQTHSMQAVVEWLAGNRVAFTNREDRVAIRADWCNGHIAMTGKSYLGTLATAVATTGVKGLDLIISEAAISNWYQYYRDNGLVIAPGGFQGEDCDVLAELTFSRMIQAGDYLHSKAQFDRKQAEMKELQDRKFGNYNTFWDERNYLPNVKNIQCDVVIVHGLNDWNVKPRHAWQLWCALKENSSVKSRIILHQGEHIYINNNRSLDFSDMMNALFSEKLYGVKNQANEQLPNVIWQENTQAEVWHTFSDWTSEKETRVYPNQTILGETSSNEEKSFHDGISEEKKKKFVRSRNSFSREIIKENTQDLAESRLYLQTKELNEELLLSGTPVVKLRVKSSKNIGLISVRLVDVGRAKRLQETPSVLSGKIDRGYGFREEILKEIQQGAETNEKMITIGHMNLQNRKNAWKNDELVADEYVELAIEMQPTIYRLPKGRRLALVIYATDIDYTLQGNEEVSYTVDFARTSLSLPIIKNKSVTGD
ncbi:X-Pro dipeptidyl-peptidase [Pilibacter termitis]|uniref:Xaa-Pro dipeptidyl-peptidase n=1 Tax=Pilibacter termitis TaxID=263852 RepID=A0A1T4LL06_9ENTE|nr:Xaa-Pro dipeptidyl-peptidase [Pilibacter termitis]SJZ55188.1 X-Pro dipeptidyl-peptidase [Pilibacter termitis]